VYKLRVKSFDFFLKQLLLLSFLKELMRLLLKCLNDLVFVLLDFFFLLLELNQFRLINNYLVFLLQFRSQSIQLILILPYQSLLIQIRIHKWLVSDAFCTMRKFQS